MRTLPTIIVLLAALLCLGGCKTLEAVLTAIDRPTARVTGVGFDNFTLDSLGLVFDVEVQNPYAAPLPLVRLDYALASDGDGAFLQGNAPLTGSIPAGGSKTIKLPATVSFSKLLETVSSVKPGQVVPYDADLKLSVDAPGVGELTLPLRKRGNIPVPAVPEVEVTKVGWDKITLAEATGSFAMRIKNTNRFNVGLNKLNYDLKLAGVSIADSSLASTARMNHNESATIEVPIRIKPINLGLGVINMIRGKGANYRINGVLDADTPYGKLVMPYERSGNTPFGK